MTRCIAVTNSDKRCKKSACYSDYCAIHRKLTCCKCNHECKIAERQILNNCGHIFCKQCISNEFCINQWYSGFSTRDVIKCPECETDLSDNDWQLLTSFLCDSKILLRKIVYDTYLCPEMANQLLPILTIGKNYGPRAYNNIENVWNRNFPDKQGWIRFLPAIDRLKPEIVYFKKYTDEWYDYQLVYRFFYGEKLMSFEEFQKELVEYVFHPDRIRRFGGIEYLDEI